MHCTYFKTVELCFLMCFGRREFGSHIFKMSQEDKLMFWGGSYSRPITRTNATTERKSLAIATRSMMFDYEIRGGDALKSMYECVAGVVDCFVIVIVTVKRLLFNQIGVIGSTHVSKDLDP